MKTYILLFIFLSSCFSLNNLKKPKVVFIEKQFIESCLSGRNHDLIKAYLAEHRDKELITIRDSTLNLNVISIAVFPYLIPCDKSDCIKSDIDILKILEIFIEMRPDEKRQIYNTAIKSLILYNYIMVIYTFLIPLFI